MGRYAFGAVGGFAVLAIAGCGGEISAPVDSPVTIQSSQFALTVRNVSNLALTDVTIGIKPAGVRPQYRTQLERLGVRQERDIPLSDFHGVDGDRLNLSNVTPRLVYISARDTNGTEYDLELPWK